MAVLVTATRVYPECGAHSVRTSGKPEDRYHPVVNKKQVVDDQTSLPSDFRGSGHDGEWCVNLTEPASLKVEAVVPGEVLQRGLGPSAEMPNHLGGGQGAKPGGVAIVGPARHSDQKSRREQVARPCSIDHALDGVCANGLGFIPCDDHAAPLAARDHGSSGILAQGIERRVEIGRLVQAVQLTFICEHEINRPGADEIEEFRPVTIDAKGIRQGERYVAIGIMRQLGCFQERLFGMRRIPR